MTIQDLPFVLAQMNATRCIGGQNKMIVFLLWFGKPPCRRRGLRVNV